MKRIFTIFALFLFALLCGCMVQVHFAGEPRPVSTTAPSARQTAAVVSSNTAKDEIRTVWLSYMELNPEKLDTEEAFRKRVQNLLEPMTALSVTDVFLQVRPFADAIYPSKLFPSSSAVVRHRGDPLPLDFLAVFLSEAKQANLRVHAWINPFRVSSSVGDVAAFKNDPAVGPLLNSKGAPCVIAWNGGVYFDPASAKVQSLIVRGVHELLETYDLAGVHIDDYFYPTDDASFDSESFAAYQRSGGKDDLLSFRRKNVSALLQELYQEVKSFGSDKVFSVSSSADIEKNENVFAADVKLWGSADGYCDWLIPQIYFGFSHETRPFEQCAKEWRTRCTNKSVRLLGGLAAYKVGKEDPFAGTGIAEWTSSETILGDQVKALRKCSYDGFALFSASFLNFDKKLCAKVLKNLKDVI